MTGVPVRCQARPGGPQDLASRCCIGNGAPSAIGAGTAAAIAGVAWRRARAKHVIAF